MGLDPLLAAPEGTPTVQAGLALEVGGLVDGLIECRVRPGLLTVHLVILQHI